jgi:hypothetical protein
MKKVISKNKELIEDGIKYKFKGKTYQEEATIQPVYIKVTFICMEATYNYIII